MCPLLFTLLRYLVYQGVANSSSYSLPRPTAIGHSARDDGRCPLRNRPCEIDGPCHGLILPNIRGLRISSKGAKVGGHHHTRMVRVCRG
ncbi:hypothetical protein QBC33DRAFT_552156 [Phialemonium atrogriseum]|uniref:Secreted protein n=1 Tax=Phialemonium atrogriseum TaxID=1093897 RepID=A0AAJ0BUS2_9PEZI|nr:uncharacterized protein QBC33DRAFT_552156 [Phialemonium atrogriseum]KAK1762411.1 hypothetical protein QBC33DRAFT_552156 [Phialemonium atrogriseum]